MLDLICSSRITHYSQSKDLETTVNAKTKSIIGRLTMVVVVVESEMMVKEE